MTRSTVCQGMWRKRQSQQHNVGLADTKPHPGKLVRFIGHAIYRDCIGLVCENNCNLKVTTVDNLYPLYISYVYLFEILVYMLRG